MLHVILVVADFMLHVILAVADFMLCYPRGSRIYAMLS